MRIRRPSFSLSLSRLKKLFSGFSEVPPVAFVLMGNFLSCTPPGGEAGYVTALQDGFRQLGDILAQHKNLVEQSKIMLVPGPLDPGLIIQSQFFLQLIYLHI